MQSGITATSLPDGGEVSSLVAGTRGDVICVGYNNGAVAVYVPSSSSSSSSPAPRKAVVAVLPKGPVFLGLDEAEALLWAASVDGSVHNLDLSEGAANQFRLVGRHDGEVYCACFNEDRGYFMTGDSKGDIGVWNSKEGVKQPRRVLSSPSREKWHAIASGGGHVVAARNNPEVHVFDLAGSSYEVRTLSERNTRQVRSLLCREWYFSVGFSDGTVQNVPFVGNPKRGANAFLKVDRAELVRAVVHRAPCEGGTRRFPVSSVVLYRPSWSPSDTKASEERKGSVFVSSSAQGVCLTDLRSPASPAGVPVLKGVAVSHLAATCSRLWAATDTHLVALPWDSVPVPGTLPQVP